VPDGGINVDDIPELDEAFFRDAEWRPPIKQPVTIRIDNDVLEWFRSRGKGYQTQINRLLRRYMEVNKERE
jgi:uncharacterized protein (DUF4415 family)